MSEVAYKKKLIEVALPLEAINREASREKSLRHGHPSTLHLWWARRPLAVARAVLFAQLVDDPSVRPEEFPTPEAQQRERERLFDIIRRLVVWENSTNAAVLKEARREIRRSTGTPQPAVFDPFAGGGSIPLEAQRLGLTAYAGDLNPVAVLLNKALIEIPPRFTGRPPVNPQESQRMTQGAWRGAAGLADDVRYYGNWVKQRAWERIGHLYPRVTVSAEYGGGEATVIAWLWARTVRCPNPACGARMPLVRSFGLSTKGSNKAWVEPQVNLQAKTVSFVVKTGQGTPRVGSVNRSGATCIVCRQPVPFTYVRSEGQAGRLGAQLMAIVAEGQRGRIYLKPDKEHVHRSKQAVPSWRPEGELPANPRDFKTPNYGMKTISDLFTERQLTALTTFADLITDVRAHVLADAAAAGMGDDGVGLDQGGTGAQAYADAVAAYLALAVDRLADYGSTITTWHSGRDTIRNTFARQAIPMTWDFAEVNPFSDSSGNWSGAVNWIVEVVEHCPAMGLGQAAQADAASRALEMGRVVVSTDPPYYDNIGYADLSDFFYVWLRRSLRDVYPSLFRTLLVPKASELVATPYRFEGNREAAQQFFEDGFHAAFRRLMQIQDPDYPLTVFYAYKQQESDGDEGGDTQTASTGWETMLEGLLAAGFAVTGTWPMRSEMGNRPIAHGTNALASSIVLVCRRRAATAQMANRREFIQALRQELPKALQDLQKGNVAPVDFAQAAIGPGMAIFSRYARVLESDGSSMSVRTALGLINQALDAYLEEQDGVVDPATRWAVAWFSQFGMESGPYGDADTLSRAKNTTMDSLVRAHMVASSAGKVALVTRDAIPSLVSGEVPLTMPDWVVAQLLVRALLTQSEVHAAQWLRRFASRGDAIRDLAYRLYSVADRQGWSTVAQDYNALVMAWPVLQQRAAQDIAAQGTFDY